MTDKTVTISARIPVETADDLRKRLENDGKTLREVVCEYAEEGVNTRERVTEDKSDLAAGVNTVFGEDAVKELESMATFFHISVEELLLGVVRGLTDGKLTIEGGAVVGQPDIDLSDLEEICHERNIDVQGAINKTVKEMRKGK